MNLVTIAFLESVFTSWGFAAAGLSAISIPIIIHYMNKMHRKPVYWGAMRFVVEAYQKQRSRLQIEQLLLLLIRCLILLCLGLALAGMFMPAGCSFIGQHKRLVHIVIDDALVSQIDDQIDHKNRFEYSKAQALKILKTLNPNDKVSLTWSANPIINIDIQGTLDHDKIKKRIIDKKVRNSKSQLDQAIVQISESIDIKNAKKQSQYITILSGLNKNTISLNNQQRSKVSDLSKKAKLIFSAPAESNENYQITNITPDWRMQIYLPNTEKIEIPVVVNIKRFSKKLKEQISLVKLSAYNQDQSKPIDSKQNKYKWSEGQMEQKIKFTLVIPTESLKATDQKDNTSVITIKSVITNEDQKDLIQIDNTRYTSVELKSAVNVAIVDDYAILSENGKLLQRDWLKIMLLPKTTGYGNPTAMNLHEIDIKDIKKQTFNNIDAIILVKTDEISPAAWAILNQTVKSGKMLWLHPSENTLDNTWATKFKKAFDLKWTIALESQEIKKDQKPWALEITQIPNSLRRIANEWDELLSPIKFYRKMPIKTDEQTITWLVDKTNNPILVKRKIGQGVIFFSTIAIQDQWTNLMVKNLYTALYHETLITTLGSLGNQQIATGTGVNTKDATLVSGYKTKIGNRWNQITQFQTNEETPHVIKFVNQIATPDFPGVYAASDEKQKLKLIVNPDTLGGDTNNIEKTALETWFNNTWGQDSWQWINKHKPGKFLESNQGNTHLSQWLLWLVLIFLIIELVLARIFSHALSGQPSLISQTVKIIRGSGA